MLRVIRELKPKWVVGENVSGLIRAALKDILSELEKEDYEARTYSSEARNVGGLFRGERIAIVASSNDRCATMRRDREFQTDGKTKRLQNHNRGRTQEPCLWKRWEIESRPYGVADGIPNRVDRLRCLGNAVVPQQFYPIFKAIVAVEKECEDD